MPQHEHMWNQRALDRIFWLREEERKLHLPAPEPEVQRRVLAISGEFLFPVTDVARAVADFYGAVWYDRGIVDVMAEDDAIRSAIYGRLDPASVRSLSDQIAYLANDRYKTGIIQDDREVRRFTRSTLLLVSRSVQDLADNEKPIILIGAGFNFILPSAVSIRFTAEAEQRASFFGKDLAEVRAEDTRKDRYIRLRFNRHYNDLRYHDWVNAVNLDRIEDSDELVDEMVHTILSQVFYKFPHNEQGNLYRPKDHLV